MDPDATHGERNSTQLLEITTLEISKTSCIFPYILGLEVHELANSDQVGSKMVPDGAKMFPV
jgi:hypothetical protein